MGCVFVLVCAFSSLCANLAGLVDLPILQVTVCVCIYIYICVGSCNWYCNTLRLVSTSLCTLPVSENAEIQKSWRAQAPVGGD